MGTESESKLQRRIEDRLPGQPLQWEDQPQAAEQSSTSGAARQGGNTSEKVASDFAPVQPVASQADWFNGVIDAGEYDFDTQTMRLTVKLPRAGLPPELLTIGANAMLAAAPSPVAAHATPSEQPTYWNSQRKMIERAIVGLRDGWATRKDADDALAVLGSGWATPSEQQAAPEQAVFFRRASEFGPWIECNPSEEGAVRFVATQTSAIAAREAVDALSSCRGYVQARLDEGTRTANPIIIEAAEGVLELVEQAIRALKSSNPATPNSKGASNE